MDEKTKLWLPFLLFIFMSLVLSIFYTNYKINYLTEVVNQEGMYNYCIEWDGWIDMDNMFFNCFDFNATSNILTQQCAWEIDEKTNNLRVYQIDFPEQFDEYRCSKLLKSTNVVNYK